MAPTVSAQNILWKAFYNGPATGVDIAFSNAVDSLDNVFVAGASWSSSDGYDIVTIKYDKNGVRQWVRRFDGEMSGDDIARKVAVDNLGNVIVAGITTSSGINVDYVVVKYDTNGNKLWHRKYDGEAGSSDYLNGLAVDASGNIYVTGESWGLDTHYDYDTVKYAPDGTFQWNRRYYNEIIADDEAIAVAIDPNGNPIVTGRSYSTASEDDWATIKYSPTGVLKWKRRLSGLHNLVGNDRPYGLVIDGDGNTTVYGTADHALTDTVLDWLVARYDARGTLLWRWSFDGPKNGNDECRAGVVLPSGEFVGTGSVSNLTSGSGNLDIWTVKLSNAGKAVWKGVYKGAAGKNDIPNAAVLDGSSNTIITGRSDSASGSADCITLKYDSAGNRLWTRRFGTNLVDEMGLALSIDSLGDPILSGMGVHSGSFDYLTIKYKP